MPHRSLLVEALHHFVAILIRYSFNLCGSVSPTKLALPKECKEIL